MHLKIQLLVQLFCITLSAETLRKFIR